ncbi:MAG TPA: hypothetical protein PKW55_05110 [Spirochaetota bacterium]|nr:hypothetical protein [Spirochaetota bacterium]HOM37669.1 hypothetical protein [Spirochaetota bacterium]HPQ49627.1 hypothetical protein [Spirochaetota bacterium]
MRKLLLLSITFIIISCVKDNNGIILNFYNFPNPFHPETENTKFRAILDLTGVSSFDWELKIYSEDSSTVYEASGSVGTPSSPFDILWAGRDNRGNIVKNGIYRSWLIIKVTKTTSGYSGDTYKADFYTVVK